MRAAESIDLAGLQEMLSGSVQGTWILCADCDSVQTILSQMEPYPLDVSIGHLPKDRRAFNAISLCPDSLTSFPRALRRLVLAGVPPLDSLPKEAACFMLDLPSPMAEKLPSVDEMREVLKALLQLMRRPVHLPDWTALDMRLADWSGLDPLTCRASVLALMDMRIVELQESPFALRVPPMKKTDPDSSALWRAMQAWKRRYNDVRHQNPFGREELQ